jgi:hypothetical protein
MWPDHTMESISLQPGATYDRLSDFHQLLLRTWRDLPGYEDFEEHGMTLYFHVQVEYGFEIRSDYYEFTLTSDCGSTRHKPTILSTQLRETGM